jgi:hypothetical protein
MREWLEHRLRADEADVDEAAVVARTGLDRDALVGEGVLRVVVLGGDAADDLVDPDAIVGK